MGALLLHHLRKIKRATRNGRNLTENNHNWLAENGAGAGNTAIRDDIKEAINEHSLALLEDYAQASQEVAEAADPSDLPLLTQAKALA